MRIVKRVATALLALVLLVAAAAGGAFVYFTRQPFPTTSGTLTVPGLKGSVEVIRDKYGVPHIYADSTADLFLAQGYVHAQDRFFQMEFWRRIGQGRLAEVFGKGAARQDRFIRTLGWHRVAAEEARTLRPAMRSVLEQYAAGVNAYTQAHAGRLGFEFRVLALNGATFTPEPWSPVNSLTWGKAMAFDLGDNADAELLRATLIATGGAELAEAVMPPYPADHPVIVPSTSVSGKQLTASGSHCQQITLRCSASTHLDPRTALALARASRDVGETIGMARGSDIGSNNWVLSGAKTSTGKPILANDPHLGIQMPSIWYQIGLHCRVVGAACPFDVTGVSFAGVPGVVIGHNARIAWGVTNGTVDTQDYFIERPNPDNPNEFEFQGKFEKAEVREEVIAIKGEAPERLTVRVTRHGPIMNGVEGALADKQPMALSWAALRPGAIFESVLAINTAQNWSDFREALKLWNAPSQNFVYADVDGNIGYQFPGDIPIRANGDGSVPVPGWTGEHEWTGFIPFEQLPSRYNPPEGYIVTANNAVVDAQSPLMLMKRDWDFGYRAKRIDALIRSRDKHSIDSVKAMSFDSTAVFADELLPVLFESMGAGASVDAKSANAAAVLRAWDKRYTSASEGALIFETFKLKLAQAIFGDELGAMGGDVLGVGTGTWTAVRNVMNDERSRWWDDTRTSEKESRQQIMIAALRSATEELEKKLGPNTADWRWGALHQATFRNQTLGNSGVAPIESIFNRGPFPADGGTGLVNAVGHRTSDFAVRSVPSLRMVVDLGDLRNSALIHTTGQSGHAFHPHYDDMIAKWLAGEFNPMIWTRDDALANAGSVLTLAPAAQP